MGSGEDDVVGHRGQRVKNPFDVLFFQNADEENEVSKPEFFLERLLYHECSGGIVSPIQDHSGC